MKTIKQGLAVLLAVLLIIPALPVKAAKLPEAANNGQEVLLMESPEISFNTGNCVYQVVEKEEFADNEEGKVCFEEDGSYTIKIPEINPFFPYEVQFTYNNEVTNLWFMTPEDSVEIGGHTFYVEADFDGTVVTQMSLNVAGDTVVVYPEKKEFTNDGASAFSLLPLTERELEVDLSDYTPVELTMVALDSIFTGDTALTDTDKVMWTYGHGDDYTISSPGDKIDLSYYTYYSTSNTWQMIVGKADQLESSNVRYIVEVNTTKSREWLTSTVYTQDQDGNRTEGTVLESNYYDTGSAGYSITVQEEELENIAQAYISLDINNSIFPSTKYDYLKVYEGKFESAAEAMAGVDITDNIWNVNMAEKDAGYLLRKGYSKWITVLTFDNSNNITGCLPIRISFSTRSNSPIRGNEIDVGSLYFKVGDTLKSVSYDNNEEYKDGCCYYTKILYKGYAANNIYHLNMRYYQDGVQKNSMVTAVYVGQYASISEAKNAGAENIKDSLFGSSAKRYAADYSQGVYFSIFVGEDGESSQEKYYYCVKVEEGERSEYTLSSDTYVEFRGLKDANGHYIPSYITEYDEDSYGEYNYLTILVDKDTDISNVAPIFDTRNEIKLYAAGSSTPEESGVSTHDFLNGAVQYTASSENKIYQKNYWLQIVKADSGAGKLYINSLSDNDANTEIKDNVIYSVREVMLDGYHHDKHDILLANMGTDSIPNLAVELNSETVALDNYWTLSGDNDLSGFQTTAVTASYGKLSNLAKIRLKAKVEQGAEATGTLTIKSEDTVLMVLELTGIVGDPCITTTEIPAAVKYVPYGTMIQNNNKYSRNQVTYSLIRGTLPSGMEVKPNGELYGVPTEEGEFTFTVRMKNSYSSFSYSDMTYTLSVLKNTYTNVDGATDPGYMLLQRVQDTTMDTPPDQTLVSEGIYAEFVDLYLDGVKLAEGVDYNSESGSTRITIRGQSLTSSGTTGTHTLGIEFRTEDTDTLRRAAQNFEIMDDSTDDDSDTDTDNNNTGNNTTNDTVNNNTNVTTNPEETNSNTNPEETIANAEENSTNSENQAENTPSPNDSVEEIIYYTIQPGDSLWGIAQRYYGSGQYWERILRDNADTISSPNRIYAGQVIIIKLTQNNVEPPANTEVNTIENASENPIVNAGSYTIQAGDSLWGIARRVYGRGELWEKIYQANRNTISDPGVIYNGQVLNIPE